MNSHFPFQIPTHPNSDSFMLFCPCCYCLFPCSPFMHLHALGEHLVVFSGILAEISTWLGRRGCVKPMKTKPTPRRQTNQWTKPIEDMELPSIAAGETPRIHPSPLAVLPLRCVDDVETRLYIDESNIKAGSKTVHIYQKQDFKESGSGYVGVFLELGLLLCFTRSLLKIPTSRFFALGTEDSGPRIEALRLWKRIPACGNALSVWSDLARPGISRR